MRATSNLVQEPFRPKASKKKRNKLPDDVVILDEGEKY